MGGKVMKYSAGGDVEDKINKAAKLLNPSAAVGKLAAKGFFKLKKAKDDFKEGRSSKGRNKDKKQKPTPKTITLNMGGKVPTYAGMPMMAEGGMVKKKKKKVSKKKSIDGVARRGRTKGRMV